VALRDPKKGTFLAFKDNEYRWLAPQNFFQVGFVSYEGGAVTLRLHPAITTNIQKDSLLVSLQWRTGFLQDVKTDTSELAGGEGAPRKKGCFKSAACVAVLAGGGLAALLDGLAALISAILG
jgi:hypothetical protein